MKYLADLLSSLTFSVSTTDFHHLCDSILTSDAKCVEFLRSSCAVDFLWVF